MDGRANPMMGRKVVVIFGVVAVVTTHGSIRQFDVGKCNVIVVAFAV